MLDKQPESVSLGVAMNQRRQSRFGRKTDKQADAGSVQSIRWVGLSVVLLILTGLICSILNPIHLDKVWLALSPLIMAGLVRLLAPQK